MINQKTRRRSVSILKILTFVFFSLYTLSIFFMFGWAIINAFKDPIHYFMNAWNLPPVLSYKNFATAYKYFRVAVTDAKGIRYVNMLEMLLYSILYAGGSAFFAATTQCITAYLTARFKYKFSKIVYNVCFVALILPIIGNLPAQLHLARTLHLYDSILGMWVMKAHFLSTYYLIFYAFFSSLQESYFEAAKIDGASNYKIMTKIAFPFVSKLYLTIYILLFIAFWNDYETPNLWLPSYPVLSVGLLKYNLSYEGEISATPLKLAGALIVSIPAFLVFFAFRNTLIGNVTLGGLKE